LENGMWCNIDSWEGIKKIPFFDWFWTNFL
jgi:hypothetical protein